jgi:hypothetical protein
MTYDVASVDFAAVFANNVMHFGKRIGRLGCTIQAGSGRQLEFFKRFFHDFGRLQ